MVKPDTFLPPIVQIVDHCKEEEDDGSMVIALPLHFRFDSRGAMKNARRFFIAPVALFLGQSAGCSYRADEVILHTFESEILFLVFSDNLHFFKR